MLHGWKDVAEEELQPFYQNSGELNVMDGCTLGRSSSSAKARAEVSFGGTLPRSSWSLKHDNSLVCTTMLWPGSMQTWKIT